MLGCLLSLFLKSMKDVNRFLESCDINDLEFIFCMNTDFTNFSVNDRHRFPIFGFKAVLDFIQLIPGLFTRILGKSVNNIKKLSLPFNRFHTKPLYKKLYVGPREFLTNLHSDHPNAIISGTANLSN